MTGVRAEDRPRGQSPGDSASAFAARYAQAAGHVACRWAPARERGRMSSLAQLDCEGPDGRVAPVMVRRVTPGPFGLEYPEDCLRQLFGAFRRARHLPDNAAALAMAVTDAAGEIRFLSDEAELFVVEEYLEGELYGQTFHEVGDAKPDVLAQARHLEIAATLARQLAALHGAHGAQDAVLHRRALRDLVSGGEGVGGLLDGYPPMDEGLRALGDALEQACLIAVQRQRRTPRRLCRTHGDLHPWNILLRRDAVSTIDPSRTEWNDPAIDVGSMLANYLVAAVRAGKGSHSFGLTAARRFLGTYLEASGDEVILATLPAFIAARCPAVVSPVFYPHLPDPLRRQALAAAIKVCLLPALSPDLSELVDVLEPAVEATT